MNISILIYLSLIWTRAVALEEGFLAKNPIESQGDASPLNNKDEGFDLRRKLQGRPPGVAPEVGAFFVMVSSIPPLLIVLFYCAPVTRILTNIGHRRQL